MATAKQQLAGQLFCHTAVALRELAGGYYPGVIYRAGIQQESVRAFQAKWNMFRPLAAGEAAYANTPTSLTTDGMYGPNTAQAMDMSVGFAFALLGIQAPRYNDRGISRILPRRAADVAAWALQWKSVVSQMCPTDQPQIPQPAAPGVPQAQPAPPPAIIPESPKPAPEPTRSLYDIFAELAKNTRYECTPGYSNVFRREQDGKTIWVTDKLAVGLHPHQGFTFLRKQTTCEPIPLPVPEQKVTSTLVEPILDPAPLYVPQEDNTRLLAGIGLAAVALGAVIWLRGRKKGK